MEAKKYRKGKVVFWQGEPGGCLYFIRYGSVGVYVNYGETSEEKLAELGAGDYFGEMGLLDHKDRAATVVSLDHDTTLCRITDDEFDEFLHENPARVVDILQRLSHKLRTATKSYLKICQAVNESVDAQEDEVAEAKSYGFAQNETLRAIHDDVHDNAGDKA